MAVFYAPETAMAKELRKWEYGDPADGYRGHRHQVITEFPKALYKAGLDVDERLTITETILADSRDAQRNLESRGYHEDQLDAMRAGQKDQLEIAKLAAERGYHERWMSDAAKREVAAIEAETDRHLPVIPETPIKRRRGRPRKVEVADAGNQ